MYTHAEVDAILSVLWYTHPIRLTYEDRAAREDSIMWENNGGMFTNFSRYNSRKWKDMMGPDDPTVRGRSISRASMSTQRGEYERYYREPVMFALLLVDRIRTAVANAIEKNGGESDDGQYEEQVGRMAYEEVVSDPEVRKRLAEIARDWCNVDASSVCFQGG